MENEERIKALNILFAASGISLLISIILALILEHLVPGENKLLVVAVLSPVITYIIGRILCFKEYKDEAS